MSGVQQGITAEGIHVGGLAGTVDLVLRVPTGIGMRGDVMRLTPALPQQMEPFDMRIHYRGHSLDLRILLQHDSRLSPVRRRRRHRLA